METTVDPVSDPPPLPSHAASPGARNMPVLSESDRESGDDMMAGTSETVQRSDLSEATAGCNATTAVTSETAPRSDLSAATI
eukprot:12414492-Heterocapsa_arctica.AAC.1